jgi:hypothetical protein
MDKATGRLLVAVLPLFLVACGTSTTPTTDAGTVTPTTVASPTTSTSSGPTTTMPPATTTTSSSVLDEVEGSGCTPGPGELDDGEWFGHVVTGTEAEMEFDLACWFTGDAAVRAAAEDGEESPPPNDYYVRSVNAATRTLEVVAKAEVVWYPEFGDPTSEARTTYEDWIVQTEDRGFVPGVWLEVEDGVVVSIREQWVP